MLVSHANLVNCRYSIYITNCFPVFPTPIVVGRGNSASEIGMYLTKNIGTIVMIVCFFCSIILV